MHIHFLQRWIPFPFKLTDKLTETNLYQSKVQGLYLQTGCCNAAKQFNATTQNQVNQFYDQLGATVLQQTMLTEKQL